MGTDARSRSNAAAGPSLVVSVVNALQSPLPQFASCRVIGESGPDPVTVSGVLGAHAQRMLRSSRSRGPTMTDTSWV